jgi:DNA mismatch repair protein MutS2
MLSAEVGAHSDDIEHSIGLAAEMDLVLAKARYASRINAVEPEIVQPEGRYSSGSASYLKLVEARHPLLGLNAVPFSVEMGSGFSVLVITGPNTGGKTVTLKTIGLLSLMAQSGIPISASSESRLPLFDGVFADIGDEQSIEQTLSTFSWHMGNVVRIIKGATGKSLVLLDELGTSTDPAEGSALAQAILRYFQARGTLAVSTTHYSDLKSFAYATDGMENASLEFDPVTLTPTYRLTVGIPGGSNAMATAARLGVPQEIIDDAKGRLTGGSHELEGLLSSVMEEKQKVAALERDLKAERDEYARRNAELETEFNRLKSEEKKTIQDARDAIVREAAELHREIRQAAAELRKEKSSARVEEARRSLSSVRRQLDAEIWQPRVTGHTELQSETIKVGDTVLVKDAGLTATVMSISENTGEVEVQSGRTRMRLSLDSVARTTAPPDFSRIVRQPEVRYTPRELDLRGKRADEVEWALDGYLSDAAQSNLTEARIIHGIGTGTVRNIVRDFLASHPLVKSFRSGAADEGGDGATVISL